MSDEPPVEDATTAMTEPETSAEPADRWRLSIYLGPCRNELFDLEADPGEMTNLWDSADHMAVRAMLVEKLAEMEIAAVDRVPLPTSEA